MVDFVMGQVEAMKTEEIATAFTVAEFPVELAERCLLKKFYDLLHRDVAEYIRITPVRGKAVCFWNWQLCLLATWGRSTSRCHHPACSRSFLMRCRVSITLLPNSSRCPCRLMVPGVWSLAFFFRIPVFG
jgi:hypothetical protein